MAISDQAQSTQELPAVIGTRTDEIGDMLRRWRKRNRGVPWGQLVRRALVRELVREGGAGKREVHLVEKYAPDLK